MFNLLQLSIFYSYTNKNIIDHFSRSIDSGGLVRELYPAVVVRGVKVNLGNTN